MGQAASSHRALGRPRDPRGTPARTRCLATCAFDASRSAVRSWRFPVSRYALWRDPCHADRVRIRCLIVDDSPSFLVAACVLLERQGPTIVGVALTGAEALWQADTLRPNVVLVDISLGKESGLDLARRLIADDPDDGAAVILISTRVEEDVADLIADSPVAGFPTKSESSHLRSSGSLTVACVEMTRRREEDVDHLVQRCGGTHVEERDEPGRLAEEQAALRRRRHSCAWCAAW